MGKTKRKYRKNKRTRKKKGGVKETKEIAGIPVETTEPCVINYNRDRKWDSERAWILHLIDALPKDKKLTTEDKLNEREKWCGNKKENNMGYCNPKNGKAWVKIHDKIKHRCISDKKKKKENGKNYCLIDLDLSEWHHCTETCGRLKPEKDSDKLRTIKENEFQVNCKDVKVLIDGKKYTMQDSINKLKEIKKKKEKDRKDAIEKKKKEKEEEKKRLWEEKVKAQNKAEKERQKKQEEEAKKKKKKDEEHAKEVQKRKKEKELQDKKDKMNKCTKDWTERIETKKNELELINFDNIQTLEEIDDTIKKLAEINQLGQKLITHFDKCIYEFPSMKGQITAAIKKLGKEIMPLFEKTFKRQEEIEKREKDDRREEEENNGKPECKEYNDGWKPHKSCKLRCKEPETCKDPLCVIPAECKDKGNHPDMKVTRHNNKLPSCPGKICRGSIITGRPADAWTTYEYEGYVLGKKGKMGEYNGWPVIYNYNNKFPWFGMFVKERQAATTDEKKFKRWFDKYLTNHETNGKNNGRSNALRSMRDKHDINIPQKLVEYFPQKFGSGRPDWKGGKRKSKRKTNKKKFRKKGTKKNR